MANDNDWNRDQWGKAKSAFDKSRTLQPTPPEKKQIQAGRQSETVRKTQPKMNGPKPPGGIGERVAEQTNRQALAKDHEAAMKAQPQVSGKSQQNLVDLEHKNEGIRLRQKFLEAARNDKDKGR